MKLQTLILSGLLAAGSAVVAGAPAQASVSGCSAVTLWFQNGAEAECKVVIVPSQFRANAYCQSDVDGSYKWRYGAWRKVSGTTTTYCWAGWSIVDSAYQVGSY